jgi:hypothetical protein
MAKNKKSWTLEVVSQTGEKVGLTGSVGDSVGVYDKADLDRRVKAAKADPRRLRVTVKEES